MRSCPFRAVAVFASVSACLLTAGGARVATATSTPVGDSSALLPVNASLDQITAAATGAFGPTTDVTSVLAPFVSGVPAGIPTPADADVIAVSVDYFPNAENPALSMATSTVSFTSSLPPADLVAFYETSLPADSFIATDDPFGGDDITYDLTMPSAPSDGITISVIDNTDAGLIDYVELEITHGIDPALAGVLGAWATPVPLVHGASLIEGDINASIYEGSVDLSLTTTFGVNIPLADALTQFQAGLASTPFVLDPSSDVVNGSFNLTGGEFDSMSTSLSDTNGDGLPNLTVIGRRASTV